MEKYNSNFQPSDLVLQVKRLNEIMQSTKNALDLNRLNCDFKDVLYSYQQYTDMTRIFSTFSACFVSVLSERILVTEKTIYFDVEKYFDFSPNSTLVKRLYDAKHSSSEEFEKEKKAIAEEIKNKMSIYVTETLEKLNQYSSIKFFLKSQNNRFVCFGIDSYSRGLHTSPQIAFLIDIR